MDETPIIQTISTKEDRETLKNQAVALREQEHFEDALSAFDKVISWDTANSNLKGHIDVLGHMVITYRKMADSLNTTESNEAKRLRYKALNLSEEAIKLTDDNQELVGSSAIQKTHYASACFSFVENEENQLEKTKVIKQAYKVIQSAMENFPGSKAHLAWPAHTKAKIEYAMGNTEAALKTLTEAQTYLYEGYDDEMKQTDGALKINVWTSGIFLTMASIFANERKPILARHYAQIILNIDDPTGTLSIRKTEAQRILDKLNVSN